MAWVLKCERHYTNGKSAVFYHKGFPLGLFAEAVGDPGEAKQFRTKKDALEIRKLLGSGWEAVKV